MLGDGDGDVSRQYRARRNLPDHLTEVFILMIGFPFKVQLD